MKAWHERYGPHGLRVIGVHCPGFEPSRSESAVREAVARLDVRYPVLIDSELEVWREYENEGWPARYLFDGRTRLFEYHYGEGGYEETEQAIQQLLGLQREPLAPLRPEDARSAVLVAPTAEHSGAFSGPYQAGGVWAVLDGSGTVQVGDHNDSANGTPNRLKEIPVTHPGAYPLIEHPRHTEGLLDFRVGAGVRCLATCFTPGVA